MASNKFSARVSGVGHFVPSRVVTNFDLEKIMDTSDEWIRQRSGIRERRYIEPGQTASDLACEASKLAIKRAGIESQDLDLILVATLTPEHYFPGTGSFLQRKLGLQTTPVIGIRGQCSGFIYSMSIAKAYIESGMYRHVLVCGAEVHSNALDFSTRGRNVAVLFGDGAGACVVSADEQPEIGIRNIAIHTQGEHAERLWMQYPTSSESPMLSKEAIDEGLSFPFMEGKYVFKHAVARMPQVLQEVLQGESLQLEDVDLFLFHQANLRINEHICDSLGIDRTKTYNNIDRYGNCSAASIPICLSECAEQGKIKPGDLICMTAFGSGFTWGSALVRW